MTRTLRQHEADIVIDHRHRDDHDVERMVSALHRYQQRCASQSGKRTYNQSCRCASRSPPVHPSDYALLTDKQHTFAQAIDCQHHHQLRYCTLHCDTCPIRSELFELSGAGSSICQASETRRLHPSSSNACETCSIVDRNCSVWHVAALSARCYNKKFNNVITRFSKGKSGMVLRLT